MHVRPALPDDAQRIAEIHVRSWQVAYAGIMPVAVLDGLDVDRRREQWDATLADGGPNGGAVFVAVTDQCETAGFALTGPYRNEPADGAAELWAIYADPEQWGTGAGAALMSKVLEWLRSEQMHTAHLWVLSENDRARRFYERFGWRIATEAPIEDVFDVGEAEIAEVRYELHLTPT